MKASRRTRIGPSLKAHFPAHYGSNLGGDDPLRSPTVGHHWCSKGCFARSWGVGGGLSWRNSDATPGSGAQWIEPGRRQGPTVAFWIEPISRFCLNPAHWDRTSAHFGPVIRRIKIGHFGEMSGGLTGLRLILKVGCRLSCLPPPLPLRSPPPFAFTMQTFKDFLKGMDPWFFHCRAYCMSIEAPLLRRLARVQRVLGPCPLPPSPSEV